MNRSNAADRAVDAVLDGLTTPEQEAVYGVVRDRLAFVGIMLP